MRKIFIIIVFCIFACEISAQTRTITGSIRDRKNILPGSSIVETGTDNVAVADSSGNFSITLSSSESTSLTVIAQGHYRQEVKLKSSKDDYNVKLQKADFVRNKPNLPDRLDMNPALRPIQGYIGLTPLSGIRGDFKTNTFNLDHLTFRKNNELVTFLHPAVGINEFMDGIAKNNYLSGDLDVSLLKFGFYTGKSFWSFNSTVKTHIDANIPKSLFEFAKVGLDSEQAKSYNFKNTQANAQAYIEMALGYSRSLLDDNLIVGLRPKFLIGLFDMSFKIEDLTLNAGLDQWTVSSRAVLRGSAPIGLTPTYDEDDGKFDGIDFADVNSASDIKPGYGLGIDIGGSYALAGLKLPDNKLGEILSNITISAALNDVGFISWKQQKNNIKLESTLSNQIVTGNFEIDPNADEEDDLDSQLDEIKENLEDILDLQGGNIAKRTSYLRMKMNWELEYEFIREKLFAGLLSSTQFNASRPVTELTLSGTYRPARWFAFALNYSFIHNKFNSFGTAIHIAPKAGLHLFVASDYMVYHMSPQYLPTSSKAVNFNLGIVVPIGKRRIADELGIKN